jgi:hypothetical protein
MNITNEETYLTTEELSRKIKHAKQTLYNFIHTRVFQQGVHFIKPSRKKILWVWPEIEKWLAEKSSGNHVDLGVKPNILSLAGKLRINI